MKSPSLLLPGQENWEEFTHRGREYFQYDYRHANGQLFSCVGDSLDECREKRQKWIAKMIG